MAYETETIVKAQNAADSAIAHLKSALTYLDQAYNWGIADILGGMLIVSLVKQKKIKNAEAELEAAIRYINRVLSLTNGHKELHEFLVNTSSFVKFTDSWIDNPISDIATQNKIDAARDEIVTLIEKLQQIKTGLHKQRLYWL